MTPTAEIIVKLFTNLTYEEKGEVINKLLLIKDSSLEELPKVFLRKYSLLEAVKYYKDANPDVGLKDAKDIVENYLDMVMPNWREERAKHTNIY